MIDGARAHGLDVTTEAYPYIAGMTVVNSAQFEGNWRERLGIDYGDLVLPATGEHLTQKRFEELHASTTPQSVLVFANTQEVVDAVIPYPGVMIASDGASGASAQCWDLLASAGGVCSRKKDAHPDGSAAQDDAAAGADAGAVDSGGAEEGAHAGGRGRGHRGLRSGDDCGSGDFSEADGAERWGAVSGCCVGRCWWIKGRIVEGVFPGRAVLGSGRLAPLAGTR